MKRKNIEKNLAAAVSHMVPEDAFERISLNLTPAPVEKERTSMKRTVNSENKKKNNVRKYASIAVAACLVIAIGIFGFAYYDRNLVVESVVDIDVNPSVELLTNKKNVVLEVNPINEDGKKILDGMDLEKTDIDVAVNAIVGSMLKHGYLDDENGILVTVQNDDEKKAEELRNIVVSDIDASLSEHNASAPVINQTLTDATDAEAFAKANNISVGKATFVLNLVKKDATLKAEELAKLSLKDLAGIVNAKNIDISDIVDYDADDSIWENIADEVEDVNEGEARHGNNADSIAPAKAKEIALKDAGIDASKASFIRVEADFDDGVKKYDVEFVSGGFEYEYEINAQNGNIIKREKEKAEGNKNTATQPVSKATNANNSNSTISSAKAKEVALAHAGVTADKVAYIKAEYDYDNGVREYEVEFKVDGVEYDYVLNAETGAIISYEKDRDYNSSQPSNNQNNEAVISADKAKEIALKHAGVAAAKATGLKAEYDVDDGRKVYDVEFRVGRVEYEYEINAVSGAVIGYEKD